MCVYESVDTYVCKCVIVPPPHVSVCMHVCMSVCTHVNSSTRGEGIKKQVGMGGVPGTISSGDVTRRSFCGGEWREGGVDEGRKIN